MIETKVKFVTFDIMIAFFSKFLHLLWRLWFYILVMLPILLLFPLLLITTANEKLYPQFFWLARNIWANIILYGMGFSPKIFYDEDIEKGKSYMFIANHTSMIDIMLMLKLTKNPFVFVGKKELVKMPIFGFFYKRVTIMVDRNSAQSRTAVYKRAKSRLDQGLSICIFPEGGVPEESVFLDEFKDGAFRLAVEYKIPIVPIAFADNKKRFPFSFFKGSPGKMRARVLPFLETRYISSKEEQLKLKSDSRQMIKEALEKFNKAKGHHD